MENVTLAIAFLGGILSFLSPCCLAMMPGYVAHLAGASVSDKRNAGFQRTTFLHSLVFVAGFSMVFVAIGVSLGLVGFVLTEKLPLLSRIGGVILILAGLNLIGILKIPFLFRTRQLDYSPSQRLGYLRSFLIGMTFSIGWTPCVGPILGGILTLAITSESVGNATYLLVAYSIGLGIPFLATGAAIGTVSRYLNRFNRYSRATSLTAGTVMLGLGVFMALGQMWEVSRYFNIIWPF